MATDNKQLITYTREFLLSYQKKCPPFHPDYLQQLHTFVLGYSNKKEKIRSKRPQTPVSSKPSRIYLPVKPPTPVLAPPKIEKCKTVPPPLKPKRTALGTLSHPRLNKNARKPVNSKKLTKRQKPTIQDKENQENAISLKPQTSKKPIQKLHSTSQSLPRSIKHTPKPSWPKNGREKGKEKDEHRISQREKQIKFGYNTVGYARYLSLVPKEERKAGMPQTPDKHQLCSKRSFDGQVRKWRRMLHEWDPPADEMHEWEQVLEKISPFANTTPAVADGIMERASGVQGREKAVVVDEARAGRVARVLF